MLVAVTLFSEHAPADPGLDHSKKELLGLNLRGGSCGLEMSQFFGEQDSLY